MTDSKDTFFLAGRTHVIGVGYWPSTLDTVSQIHRSGPKVCFGELVEPYQVGAGNLLVENELTETRLRLSSEQLTHAHHARIEDNAVLIDTSYLMHDMKQNHRWILMELKGDEQSIHRFANCECHRIGQNFSRGQLLCLAQRIRSRIADIAAR